MNLSKLPTPKEVWNKLGERLKPKSQRYGPGGGNQERYGMHNGRTQEWAWILYLKADLAFKLIGLFKPPKKRVFKNDSDSDKINKRGSV